MTSFIRYVKDLDFKQKLLLLIPSLIFLGFVINLFFNTDIYLWDFKVYYSAADCYRNHLNPYNTDILYTNNSNVASLPYMYPPIVMYYFLPFTLFTMKTASMIYLSIKIICLFLMIYVWSKIFDLRKYLPVFLIYSIFAFNGALHKDLYTGNITIFESLMLWLAVYFFIKDKLGLFSILVILLSTIKIMPIVFLGFLFFSPDKNRLRYFIGSSALFMAYIGLNFLLEPFYMHQYISSFAQNAIKEGGIANASSLEFFKSVSAIFKIQEHSIIPMIMYFVFVLLIVGYTVYFIYPMRKDRNTEKRNLIIFTLTMAALLILPRFKDYSYVIVLLPVFYVLTKSIKGNNFYLLIILTFLSANNVSIPVFVDLIDLLWGYYTLIIVFLCWIFCLNYSKKFMIATDN